MAECPTKSAAVGTPVLAVVDDDERVRESIGILLSSAGYSPLLFSCAEEFLQSEALGAAICLITDVRMPGMGGLELQRRVRRERPALAIIFISAHRDENIRKQALEEGGVRFFYKPFDATELLGAIQATVTSPNG